MPQVEWTEAILFLAVERVRNKVYREEQFKPRKKEENKRVTLRHAPRDHKRQPESKLNKIELGANLRLPLYSQERIRGKPLRVKPRCVYGTYGTHRQFLGTQSECGIRAGIHFVFKGTS